MGKIDGMDMVISGKLSEAFTQATRRYLEKELTEDLSGTLSKLKTLMDSRDTIADMATCQQSLLNDGITQVQSTSRNSKPNRGIFRRKR